MCERTHSTFYPHFVHSQLVAMVVSELSQPISTSSQHCAHSTFYQHCAHSQFVLMIGFLAHLDHINMLSTFCPLTFFNNFKINIPSTSLPQTSNICPMGDMKISSGDGMLVGRLLTGCGIYVDFVPINYPHFLGPTIVQQHRSHGLQGHELEIPTSLDIA